jgi:hypothetical protein
MEGVEFSAIGYQSMGLSWFIISGPIKMAILG